VRRGLATLARLGAVALLVVSGGYVLLYLYRWEWNRALIAGIFFLAAEIAVVAMALADRLSVRTAAPAPPVEPHFRWLEPDRFSVVVPALLGEGIVLTVLAYVVERVARWTAPAASASLPGLALDDARLPRRGNHLLTVAAVAAATVVLAVGLRELADVAQSRADPPAWGQTTTFEVRILQRRADDPVEVVAERFATVCVPHDPYVTGVERLDGERVALSVTPDPGRTDRRRIEGCVQDALLDRVRAHVLSVTTAQVPGASIENS